jgi:hypothetical protein
MPDRSKLEMTQRWAEIVIERWQARMEALGVGDTGTLLRSFRAQVDQDSSGDPTKVTFAFLLYGRFPDMGVGRGISFHDAPTGNRQVKPWYSKTFLAEVLKLGRMMATRYGIDAAMAINAFSSSIYTKAVVDGK